jgi:hypothetical protein
MGLWRQPSEWDDYEWIRLADLVTRAHRPARAPEPEDHDAATEMAAWLIDELDRLTLWPRAKGPRVLLVDLDNLRAAPSRLRARMTAVVHIARQADVVAFAGQAGAARRSRRWLADFADQVVTVPDGSDLADHALLDRASGVAGKKAQFVVVSNDGIFARLADRGPVALVSPGSEAMSDRLRDCAHVVVDLPELEKAAAADRARRQRVARRRQAEPAGALQGG